jgi:hypothetical protein
VPVPSPGDPCSKHAQRLCSRSWRHCRPVPGRAPLWIVPPGGAGGPRGERHISGGGPGLRSQRPLRQMVYGAAGPRGAWWFPLAGGGAAPRSADPPPRGDVRMPVPRASRSGHAGLLAGVRMDGEASGCQWPWPSKSMRGGCVDGGVLVRTSSTTSATSRSGPSSRSR